MEFMKKYFTVGGVSGPGKKKKKKEAAAAEAEAVPYADFDYDKGDPVERPHTQEYQDTDVYNNATPRQKNLLDYKYNNRMYFDPETGAWEPIPQDGTSSAMSNMEGFNNYMVSQKPGKSVGFKVASFYNPETKKQVRVPAEVLPTQVGVGTGSSEFESLFQQ